MRESVAGPAGRRAVMRAATVFGMLMLLGGDLAVAQISGRPAGADLRVEWSAGADRRGRPVVSGYVYNERGGSYATAVRLRVDALDAGGQVIGSTTGYVLGDVPPSSRSYFEVGSPAPATDYRVTIESFAWRAYGAGGA